MKNYRNSKIILFNCIKNTFEGLEEMEKKQKELDIDTRSSQYFERNMLNAFIREYVALGGNKNIDKYLKYYV